MKPVQDSLALVKDTQTKVNGLLKDRELNSNLLSINASFQQIIARLTYMGGILEPSKSAEDTITFPPITNFMGSPINVPEKFTAADLNPREAEIQKFKEKVQKLYDTIEDIPVETIFQSYTIPEDVLVLRGVAKWAEVPGYADHEITIPWIEDIVLAVEMKKEQDEAQKKIDETTSEGLTQVVLTKQMIDDDPALKKKAVPGDILVTDTKGRKTLKKPELATA